MNQVGQPWKCACGCGATAPATQDASIPQGWYGIRQYPGNRDERPKNLGVYSSPACLARAASEMAERVA